MTQIQKLKNYLAALLMVFAVFFTAVPVFAAEFTIESKTQEIGLGDQFEANIFLDIQEESINAVEGKIIFPEDLLELKEIKDGNSIINFWIEKPKSAPEGQIAFSGIVPGGYSDSRGLIFSITFLAKKEGSGAIGFDGVKALLNDGQGTEAPLAISNFQFSISEEAPAAPLMVEEVKDTDPPEEFKPEIAQSPEVFDGKYFLVFATQDKGSGIDHYEVCEGQRKCVTAESPYLLKNQDLDKEIVVKAIDKSSNEKIATLPSQKPRIAWYQNYSILIGILILAAAIIYLIWKFLWKKRRK